MCKYMYMHTHIYICTSQVAYAVWEMLLLEKDFKKQQMVLLLIYENIMRKMTVFHSIKNANRRSRVFYVNKVLTCLLAQCPLFPKKQYVVKMNTQRTCPNPDTHRCNETSVIEMELCLITPGELLKRFCAYSVFRIFVILALTKTGKEDVCVF